MTESVEVSHVTLVYHCPECGADYSQSADELVENGTAFCTNCDVDCDLSYFLVDR